jgi:hypothetical protein
MSDHDLRDLIVPLTDSEAMVLTVWVERFLERVAGSLSDVTDRTDLELLLSRGLIAFQAALLEAWR